MAVIFARLSSPAATAAPSKRKTKHNAQAEPEAGNGYFQQRYYGVCVCVCV